MNPPNDHHQTVAHPWHGIQPFAMDKFNQHKQLTAFIEMSPLSEVKLEVDKQSGHLIIDRPNKFSNQLPCLYGFIPQTYCDRLTAQLAGKALTERDHHPTQLDGDLDPLDICVFTDRQLHGNVLAHVQVIGGLCMLDSGEIDDKIIAVLCDDTVYGACQSIHELPKPAIAKLLHYFSTYKQPPHLAGETAAEPKIVLTHTYDAHHAAEVIMCAYQDYRNTYNPAPPDSA